MGKLKNAVECWCGSGESVWGCLVYWRGCYHWKRREVVYGDKVEGMVAWHYCGRCRDFTEAGSLAEAKAAAEQCAADHRIQLIYRG